MAKLDPTIRHAITPPDFSAGNIHREYLVDRLHGEIPRKLVAIAAPAGYGKTTLLADFIAHSEIPIVWAQMTNADQDAMRLAGLLLASFERRFRRLRGKLDIRAFAGERPSSAAKAILNLTSENVPESFLVILDDVHAVHRSPEAMEFLDTFATEIPEQATLFAAGREVLEVSLARLMAEGNLAGLGPHDLALSRGEIRAVVERRIGESLSDHEVESLFQETRGWVTGIVLSEYGGNRASLATGISEQLASEYLASVVLNRQPDRIRRFMLDASVLPVMTGSLCDRAIGRENSSQLLEEIASRGLFVTASTGEERSFEFHPMFRELLRDTLNASDGERFVALRERAAEVLKAQDPETALALLIDADQLEEAGNLAEEVVEEFFWRGRYATIQSWFDQLRTKSVNVPSLAYYIALSHMNKGHYDTAADALDELAEEAGLTRGLESKIDINRGMARVVTGREDGLEAIMKKCHDSINETDADNEIVGRFHRLRANKASHIERDLEAANLHIANAVAALENSSNSPLLVAALQDQAKFLAEAGDLRQARAVTLQAHELVRDSGSPVAKAVSLNNLAYIEYMRGGFEEALRMFDEARAVARNAGLPATEALATYGQAETFSDLRLTVQAAVLFEEGLDLSSSLEDNGLLATGCIGTSILHRRAGSFRLAGKWLSRATEFAGPTNAAMVDAQRAALIGESDPLKAIEILRALRDDVDLGPREAALVHFFLARFLLEIERNAEASEEFRKCLEVCNLHGVVQVVVPEIAATKKMKEWGEPKFRDYPSLQVLTTRLEIGEAVRSHYKRDTNTVSREEGLTVKALGTSEVLMGGESMDDLKPQALELLMFLVDQGAADRDEIAETFWADHPAGRQTANLHMAIYSIRRKLGKHSVVLDGTVYRLNAELPLMYDVELFEQASRVVSSLPPGDPRRLFALTEATSLYKGKYLPEYFSDWVQERRRLLELEFLDIAADHAEEALLRDQPDRALDSLRTALSLDPYRDDINEKYLRVLSRLDRRSDVMAHYRRYANLMREDLGLEPSKSLIELHEEIAGRS